MRQNTEQGDGLVSRHAFEVDSDGIGEEDCVHHAGNADSKVSPIHDLAHELPLEMINAEVGSTQQSYVSGN